MSRILKEMHETAKGLYDAKVLDPFTMHQMDELCLSPVETMEPREIKELRLNFKVSQPVFAKLLNVKPVTVKKWELGENSPNGSSLKLLHVIKRNGLDFLKF